MREIDTNRLTNL